MKCDHCEREATLHDTKLLQGGVVKEVHLCEKCAAELGFAGKNFHTVDDLLQQAIEEQSGMILEPTKETEGETGGSTGAKSKSPGSSQQPSVRANVCVNCSTTWAEFRERGLFGCAECYVVFADRIGPLLERAQEGGTHHVGKCPSNAGEAGGQVDLTARIRHLRRQLTDALGSEQYERAVNLRDQINSLAVTSGSPLPTTDNDGEAGAS